MTEQQKKWMDVLKLKSAVSKGIQAEAPMLPIRKVAFNVVTHPLFDECVMAAILLNVAVMALPYYGAPAAYTRWLALVNKGFSCVFIFEALMKVLGVGPKQYIADRWN